MNAQFLLSELDDLFQRAVVLPDSKRAEFLEHECGDRAALKAELQRMLHADVSAGDFLASSLPSHLISGGSRKHIGRWNLLEQIGEGGVGIVYHASCEADGITLHAAVKILRTDFDANMFQQRFVEERNILSGLDHPYIARLIDVGADPRGSSFLAVEFVPGRPLDRYLEEFDAPVHERLEIFVRICEAVEYLHYNHIVHGDIKPGNVMIKPDGTPKLLDFGAARLIDPGHGKSSSGLSRLIMTPEYASPEQLAGLGPSMAGDVYSLGCVLRDMLERITPELDLAAIRDRCLSHSPTNRYPSAQEIAADVQRYLGHFPVHAQAASGWYISRKFIRRNRLICSFAGFAVAALFGASLSLRYESRRAEVYQGQQKSVVRHLVGDKTTMQAPESTQTNALSESIEDAIAHLEAMTPQPLAELSRAWRRVSYAEARTGRTPQAIQSIQNSIDYARRDVVAADSPDSMANLAESLLYATLLRNRRGELEKAGDHGIEAARLIETLPGAQRSAVEKTPEFLYSLFSTARRMALSGDIESGRSLLLRGLETSRSMGKSLQLRLLLDLATFERRAGNPGRVEAYCNEAKSLGLTHQRLENLCDHQPREPGQRATALLEQVSLLEQRLVLDPENFVDQEQLARLRFQLAQSVAATGDMTRAASLLEEAAALTKALLGTDPQNRRLRALLRNIGRQRQRNEQSK